ncbi:MAG: pyridoxamine 5'-phosphate oxidase family protein [Candidatus Tantalella remota]|nr:pyridoxamine 5'-phosphate oxidase family protein [Candidatus Tantalella remota]
MRRKNQEITDKELLHKIIDQAEIMRLGMCKDNIPYVVPLSFGFDGEYIYFHSSKSGLKMEYLKKNPNVCFEMESEAEVVKHETDPCKFNFSYRSVIGFGEATEVKGNDEKRKALNVLIKQYSEKEWSIPLAMILAVGVWRVRITGLFGKQSKDNIKKN